MDLNKFLPGDRFFSSVALEPLHFSSGSDPPFCRSSSLSSYKPEPGNWQARVEIRHTFFTMTLGTDDKPGQGNDFSWSEDEGVK